MYILHITKPFNKIFGYFHCLLIQLATGRRHTYKNNQINSTSHNHYQHYVRESHLSLLTGHVFKFRREYYHCRLKMFHSRLKYLNLNFNGGLGQIQGEKKYKQVRSEEPGRKATDKLGSERETIWLQLRDPSGANSKKRLES